LFKISSNFESLSNSGVVDYIADKVDTHNIAFYFGSNFNTLKSSFSPSIDICYNIHFINSSFILGDNYIFGYLHSTNSKDSKNYWSCCTFIFNINYIIPGSC